MMTLPEYVAQLKPHDASLAAALLEFVRLMDADGAVDRGEWRAAVHTGYSTRSSAEHENPGLLEAADAEPGQEQERYFEDHILARLAADGIVIAEVGGLAADRPRLSPAYEAAAAPDRKAELLRDLERAVGDLLAPPDRVRQGNGRPPSVVNGSTLYARGLVKIYRRRRVVAEVDVNVSQGEIVGLLGPNGAGKTTTFYMIVGLIGPDRGKVFLDEQELTRTPMYRRARAGIGYLAQEPSIFRKLTVEQNILAILETMPLSRSERKARLETVLDELGLKHLRKARAYSLSGGERRRLEITRALVSQPKFMLLDEPFAGVDPIAVHDIQQIVADLRHRGIGVIISDHNVEQTLDIVDRAYIMYDGKVRVSGTVAELVWNDEVSEIYLGPTLTARMRERYRRPEAVAI
jgi:lipopolysaccharide export system ATP-binding protein